MHNLLRLLRHPSPFSATCSENLSAQLCFSGRRPMKESVRGAVISIDSVTTNSCVAVLEGKQAKELREYAQKHLRCVHEPWFYWRKLFAHLRCSLADDEPLTVEQLLEVVLPAEKQKEERKFLEKVLLRKLPVLKDKRRSSAKLLRDPAFLLRLYQACLGRADVEEIFPRKFLSSDRTASSGGISVTQFHAFLAGEQRDKRLNEVLFPPISVEAAQRIIGECKWATNCTSDFCGDSFPNFSLNIARGNLKSAGSGDWLSEEGFLHFLMSAHNLPLRKDLYERNDDQMNRPLSHYFINASHNTYLKDRQMKSRSSVSMFRSRVDSSNYMPLIFWNCGCQMAAINLQTADLPNQVNLAMFEMNAKCGFIPKPACISEPSVRFSPFELDRVENVVAEDALGGTPVIQVQAIDPDRDQFTYSFLDEDGEELVVIDELFQINPNTGLIRLRPGTRPTQLLRLDSSSFYNFTVLALDDGSCCAERGEQRVDRRPLRSFSSSSSPLDGRLFSRNVSANQIRHCSFALIPPAPKCPQKPSWTEEMEEGDNLYFTSGARISDGTQHFFKGFSLFLEQLLEIEFRGHNERREMITALNLAFGRQFKKKYRKGDIEEVYISNIFPLHILNYQPDQWEEEKFDIYLRNMWLLIKFLASLPIEDVSAAIEETRKKLLERQKKEDEKRKKKKEKKEKEEKEGEKEKESDDDDDLDDYVPTPPRDELWALKNKFLKR